MNCLHSTSFSFMLNGEEVGHVQPSQGLRQGDPLSPYLFLICSEGLSRLLQSEESTNNLKGLRLTRHAPSISHLLFADDSLLFCEATNSSARAINKVLDIYHKASGQLLNTANECHERYLGLPAFSEGDKKEMFSDIKERIWQKLHAWNEKLFSVGGKEVLLKAVVQSIPTYAMSYFRLPTTFCNQLESMMANFWWGSNKDGSKIHWRSWKLLYQREWNVPLLNAYFQPIDMDKIVTIPLSFFPNNDRYIWHHTTTGIYSVNSGFHLAENLAENRNSSGSSAHKDWWKTFWGLNLPSKVKKKFAWRVMQNALPVATALCRRKVINSATCSLCLNAWESIGHAMFNCTKAKAVWRETKFSIDHAHAQNMHSGDYLIHLSSIHSKPDFELIVCTMWAIWHERNKVIHGGVSRTSLTIATFAQSHLEKFVRHQLKKPAKHFQCWCFICCCSRSVLLQAYLKILGCGALVRDCCGNVIAAISKSVQGCFRSDEMEAKSLFHSLNWALQLQLLITHIETDALRVSTALNSASRNLSSFNDLITDISYLLSFFSGVTISYVKRDANHAAHGLAKYALEVDEDVCWMGEIPAL
uniref:Reverse transcriptase domain-containing protein n=1 Tax=Cannabis sativa TaxID=3483 RepID=A0A803Q490_CANSA